MLIPKKNRKLIYENLFKEGVMVAKKDFYAPKHNEIEGVPNLQVIKAMQASCSAQCLQLLSSVSNAVYLLNFTVLVFAVVSEV